MLKSRTCFFMAACLCLSQQAAFAEEIDHSAHHHPVEELDSRIAEPEHSLSETDAASPTAKEIWSEVIIRPVAALGSLTGLALFVVASPVSGLASIPEPHDVFKTTWDNFVVTPYHFAFRRPFGDYSVELN